MKKSIWIINHYAGQMFFEKGMRHYWIAKYLKKKGYEPIVICSNAKHNTKNELFFPENRFLHTEIAKEIDVPFVFVKSRPYTGNGRTRVLNMIDFYKNTQKAASLIAKEYGPPDIIYASSVHPLTLIAGLHIARSFGVKCICEIRDLWPESLVAYGVLREKSILTKLLYLGEKYIYTKADKVVMTWPGGYDYIRDRGWERVIPESKVVHISNGIDLAEYRKSIITFPYRNRALSECAAVRIVYTGSIRRVNNLGILLKAVEILKRRGVANYKLFLFGDGDEREKLEELSSQKHLDNVCFMGKVPKRMIPSILVQSNVNILHNSSSSLDKYGQSQNKFFEYLASGRPIFMTYSVGYSIVKAEQCGIELSYQTADSIADAIQLICTLPKDKLDAYGNNALRCADRYDFKYLTNQVISLIESA